MVHHLAPSEQRRPDTLEHRGELFVGVVIMVAVGIVPLPGEIDALEGMHLDLFEPQLPARVATDLDLGVTLPRQHGTAVGDLAGDPPETMRSTFSSRPRVSQIHVAQAFADGIGNDC